MIAYGLAVHKNPNQVSRLMQSIYSSEDLYYINIFGAHSHKKRAEWIDSLRSFEKSNVSFVFKFANAWGTFDQVKATIDSMEHFKDADYSYFINLSGQCYPIKSIRSIKETLARNRRSYIEFNKMPDYRNYEKDKNLFCPYNTDFHSRFEYCYYPVPNWGSIQFVKGLMNWRKDITSFIRIPRRNKKLLHSFDLYKGSNWFCLQKAHVEYILDFIKNNPDYVKFFSTVLSSDEHFFQTILLNSSHKSQIVNDEPRYLVWPTQPVYVGVNGPEILCTKDIDDILHSEKFFARKFDMDIDSKVLDIIDLNNNN